MIPASDLLNRRTGVFLFYFIGMAVCMHKKRMHIPAEIHPYHCCKNIRFPFCKARTSIYRIFSCFYRFFFI